MNAVRLAAATALLAVERGEVTLATAVESARRGVPDPRDRALLLELTSGVLRWRQELDALIAAASRRSISQVDPRALAVLRLGAFQLRHLARVPAHAVVHESVDVVRALGAPRAAGFVNAVLRAMQRRGRALALPPRPGIDGTREAQLRYLATTLSHPAWLAERWIDRYGFEATAAWCAFNNAPPPVTVRSAGRLSSAELLTRLVDAGVAATAAPIVHDAIRLEPGGLGRVPAELRAELRVQDEGAQLIARLAGARPGERVLDVCAAPGGKALVSAWDMGLVPREDGSNQAAASRSSLLVAADFRESRVALLAKTIRLAGLAVPVVRLDGTRPLPFQATFDLVILDVPCSGLGILRRDPDLKWRRRPEDLDGFASDAEAMLRRAAEVVRPGGRLVYATCSSEPEENERVVSRFLAADTRFRLADPNEALPMPFRGPQLVTTPFEHGLDAFFGAVLVRTRAA